MCASLVPSGPAFDKPIHIWVIFMHYWVAKRTGHFVTRASPNNNYFEHEEFNTDSDAGKRIQTGAKSLGVLSIKLQKKKKRKITVRIPLASREARSKRWVGIGPRS